MNPLQQVGGPVPEAWMAAWEKQVLFWINGHHDPFFDPVMAFVSLVGEWGACWIALLLSLLIWGKPEHKSVAVWLGLTMLITSLCVVVPLRLLFPRDRPYEVLPEIRQMGLALSGSSFPSGHVQSAWLAAVALGGRWRGYAVPLTVFALLVSYSRLYSGMHYPLDIVAGCAIGVTAGVTMLHLRAWRRRAKQQLIPARAVPE